VPKSRPLPAISPLPLQVPQPRTKLPIIEPGTFQVGFPGLDAKLVYLYRCPHCWFDWLGIPHRQPQTAFNEPAKIQCPSCGRLGDYVGSDTDAYAEKKIRPEVSLVRRKRAKGNHPLSLGLFDGISDGPREREDDSGEGPGKGTVPFKD
jgi:hypothetical protein